MTALSDRLCPMLPNSPSSTNVSVGPDVYDCQLDYYCSGYPLDLEQTASIIHNHGTIYSYMPSHSFGTFSLSQPIVMDYDPVAITSMARNCVVTCVCRAVNPFAGVLFVVWLTRGFQSWMLLHPFMSTSDTGNRSGIPSTFGG